MDPGSDALRDPLANRGTAFSAAERARLGLAGRLPPRVETLAEQSRRVAEAARAIAGPLERHAFLAAVQDSNETLFSRVVVDHLQELLPIVYTPTVGQVCQEWSGRFLRPRGLYLTPAHRGSIATILRGLRRDIGIIVVTDGGRILGLGDLGANGMGIPIGKLALYTACAGVPPARCLPITLDVGTDTPAVREDPAYLGTRAPRLTGTAYFDFLEEFVAAVGEVFPDAILQFEDFNNASAFELLARHRERVRCFNDDIQGTGAMVLAGLRAAGRLTGRTLGEERLLFVGAGEAGLGIAALVVAALQAQGLDREAARARCLFIDSKGTVVAARTDLASHKRPYAQERVPLPDLEATIEAFRPTVLVGACGGGTTFSERALQALQRTCPLPVVFALSNPTSKSECTAEQAYRWTAGRVIFASGSPFEPVTIDGTVHAPGQANNAYIFPGVGLGLLVSGARRVTDAMFLAAATALAGQVSDADRAVRRIYPLQGRLREVAAAVAVAVARVAFETGLAARSRPADLAGAVAQAMTEPAYA